LPKNSSAAERQEGDGKHIHGAERLTRHRKPPIVVATCSSAPNRRWSHRTAQGGRAIARSGCRCVEMPGGCVPARLPDQRHEKPDHGPAIPYQPTAQLRQESGGIADRYTPHEPGSQSLPDEKRGRLFPVINPQARRISPAGGPTASRGDHGERHNELAFAAPVCRIELRARIAKTLQPPRRSGDQQQAKIDASMSGDSLPSARHSVPIGNSRDGIGKHQSLRIRSGLRQRTASPQCVGRDRKVCQKRWFIEDFPFGGRHKADDNDLLTGEAVRAIPAIPGGPRSSGITQ